jgi:hypothetical protein
MKFSELQEEKKQERLKEAESLLLENETIKRFFSLISDYMAITDKRLIYVDGKFIGMKKAIVSLSFNKITCVAMEKGGFMKFTSDIKICAGKIDSKIKFLYPEDALDFYKAVMLSISES